MPQGKGFLFEADFEGDEAAAAALKALDKLTAIGENIGKVLRTTCERLKPDLRKEIHASWIRGGLGSVSGDLERATADAVIEVTERGIAAQFPAGLNKHVYGRGGIYQFGGVIGTGKGHKKSKVNIQAAVKFQDKYVGGGVRVVAARNFFSLDASQVNRLTLKWAQYFTEEAAKIGGK